MVNSASADCGDDFDSYETFTTYKKIKKTFGKPTNSKTDGFSEYEYVDDVFSFWFYISEGSSHISGVTIDITSKKATLNGIKVGMTYKKVKKKLESVYGKKLVETSKDKDTINLQYAGYEPITITLTNGKVSKIYFFCS